jgi:glutathione synthase/RimK-type ligase-like ATP-grasp enzyme
VDFAGVDIMFGADGPVLCEVNSNAHFKNIYECTGINVGDAIMEYIFEDQSKKDGGCSR